MPVEGQPANTDGVQGQNTAGGVEGQAPGPAYPRGPEGVVAPSTNSDRPFVRVRPYSDTQKPPPPNGVQTEIPSTVRQGGSVKR